MFFMEIVSAWNNWRTQSDRNVEYMFFPNQFWLSMAYYTRSERLLDHLWSFVHSSSPICNWRRWRSEPENFTELPAREAWQPYLRWTANETTSHALIEHPHGLVWSRKVSIELFESFFITFTCLTCSLRVDYTTPACTVCWMWTVTWKAHPHPHTLTLIRTWCLSDFYRGPRVSFRTPSRKDQYTRSLVTWAELDIQHGTSAPPECVIGNIVVTPLTYPVINLLVNGTIQRLSSLSRAKAKLDINQNDIEAIDVIRAIYNVFDFEEIRYSHARQCMHRSEQISKSTSLWTYSSCYSRRMIDLVMRNHNCLKCPAAAPPLLNNCLAHSRTRSSRNLHHNELPWKISRCRCGDEEAANDEVRVRWMIVTFVFLLITMTCEESWLLKASAECTIDTSVRRERERREKKT